MDVLVRCGFNIKTYGGNDNIQIQAFSVSGFYAGSGICIDPSMIVILGSNLPALRVIGDEGFPL